MSPHSEAIDESESVRTVPVAVNGSSSNGAAVNGLNGSSNGGPVNGHAATPVSYTNGHSTRSSKERSQYLVAPAEENPEYDLICVGYGPASLGVAIAMHDAMAAGQRLRPDGSAPKVLFLEKQDHFAWHAGMLLNGAKMQISFIKDLASLRDPRSEFTFLNYLHRHGRLVEFTNLSTFLPARNEYEDYLRWCSSFFNDLVRYNNEVVSVSPESKSATGAVKTFSVQSRDVNNGQTQTFRGRHVLIATGGQATFPRSFPAKNPRVLHSSEYARRVPQLLPKSNAPYRVAVVGAGQSAAEIFNNIQTLYPNSKTYLVMRQEFLKPSDDSPFVNSVFNPEFVDNVFPRSPRSRQGFLTEVRATNYGVVRLELIEHLYEKMYDQIRHIGRDETQWQHRIMPCREISSIEPHGESLEIKVHQVTDSGLDSFVDLGNEETIEADLIIAATGYNRSGHVQMLRDAWNLLPKAAPSSIEYSRGINGWNVATEQGERKMAVGRDYKVKFTPGAVSEDAGVWLQGLCEGTHGVSDTLLSVIATRSGEIVESIFGSSKKY